MSSLTKQLIVITGPTAVGKTTLSIQLAKKLNTEIISCDSKQFYREMSIGTAKPSKEELSVVKHHFINSLSIHDEYSAGKFETDALNLLEQLFEKHDTVIMTGGSGLFIKAVTEGLDQFPPVSEDINEKLEDDYKNFGTDYLFQKLSIVDPEYAQKVDSKNPRRIMRALAIFEETGVAYSSYLKMKKKSRPFHIKYFILTDDRNKLYDRINSRVDNMISNGLLIEAQQLYQYKELRSMQTVGYQELFKYFDGDWSLDYAVDKIKQHTRNYAKRQLTWFRNIPNAVFIHLNENVDPLKTIINLLKS